MTALIKYEAARTALAEAHRVDECKNIADKATAMAAYAKQAQDAQLIKLATEIKKRAERKVGQLLKEMAATGARSRGGRRVANTEQNPDDKKQSRPATVLADIGVTKSQSSRYQALADLPEDEFEASVAESVRQAARAVEGTAAERFAEKQRAREARETELGAKQCALPDKKYGVILADLEWKFEIWSPRGLGRAADNRYPVSDTSIIAARAVPTISADDCVLFLWATASMLPHALRVVEAWDFTYKTCFVWGKNKAGTGYWNRNKHEILLLGTRGNIPCPAAGTQWESLIFGNVDGHSAKPTIFREMVDKYFPSLPKIEMNCRGEPRDGWDSWGNEADQPADDEVFGRGVAQ